MTIQQSNLKELSPRKINGMNLVGLQTLIQKEVGRFINVYTQTIIAREKRDYVWIMARQSEISLVDYEKLVNFIESLGYEKSKIRKVPQNN